MKYFVVPSEKLEIILEVLKTRAHSLGNNSSPSYTLTTVNDGRVEIKGNNPATLKLLKTILDQMKVSYEESNKPIASG